METEIDSSTEQVLVVVERIVISITHQTFSLVPDAHDIFHTRRPHTSSYEPKHSIISFDGGGTKT